MLSTVDTLAVSKGFVDVGFTQEQAEKMAITYKNMKEGLATKEDLEHVKKTLEQKIDSVEEKLEQKIEHVEDNLQKDIKRVEEKLEQKIERVAENLQKDIKRVEQLLDSRIKTLFWMFGLGFVTIGGLLTAIITVLLTT